MDRRRFVRTTGLGVAGLAAGCTAMPVQRSGRDAAGAPPAEAGNPVLDAGEIEVDSGAGFVDAGNSGCSATGDDIEGPYYRPGVPVRANLNLYGETGEPLTLEGRVTDDACRPIANAVVEIWHANPTGDYDTVSQEKRYYGQAATDAAGFYAFTTLMPGRYLNGEQYRPAHIHMKVFVGTAERLTTQIYFDGDPYNDIDPFFDAARSVPVDGGTAVFPVTV